MSRSGSEGRLAEVVATYGPDPGAAPHGKISISLPSDLVELVRAAAAAGGTGVSAVVAAAIRGAMAADEPARDDLSGSIRRPIRSFAQMRERVYPPVGWAISSTELLRSERTAR